MGGAISRIFHRKPEDRSKPKTKKPRRFGSLRRQRTDEHHTGTRVARSSTMPSRTQRSENADESPILPESNSPEQQRLEVQREILRDVMDSNEVMPHMNVQQATSITSHGLAGDAKSDTPKIEAKADTVLSEPEILSMEETDHVTPEFMENVQVARSDLQSNLPLEPSLQADSAQSPVELELAEKNAALPVETVLTTDEYTHVKSADDAEQNDLSQESFEIVKEEVIHTNAEPEGVVLLNEKVENYVYSEKIDEFKDDDQKEELNLEQQPTLNQQPSDQEGELIHSHEEKEQTTVSSDYLQTESLQQEVRPSAAENILQPEISEIFANESLALHDESQHAEAVLETLAEPQTRGEEESQVEHADLKHEEHDTPVVEDNVSHGDQEQSEQPTQEHPDAASQKDTDIERTFGQEEEEALIPHSEEQTLLTSEELQKEHLAQHDVAMENLERIHEQESELGHPPEAGTEVVETETNENEESLHEERREPENVPLETLEVQYSENMSESKDETSIQHGHSEDDKLPPVDVSSNQMENEDLSVVNSNQQPTEHEGDHIFDQEHDEKCSDHVETVEQELTENLEETRNTEEKPLCEVPPDADSHEETSHTEEKTGECHSPENDFQASESNTELLESQDIDPDSNIEFANRMMEETDSARLETADNIPPEQEGLVSEHLDNQHEQMLGCEQTAGDETISTPEQTQPNELNSGMPDHTESPVESGDANNTHQAEVTHEVTTEENENESGTINGVDEPQHERPKPSISENGETEEEIKHDTESLNNEASVDRDGFVEGSKGLDPSANLLTTGNPELEKEQLANGINENGVEGDH